MIPLESKKELRRKRWGYEETVSMIGLKAAIDMCRIRDLGGDGDLFLWKCDGIRGRLDNFIMDHS